MSSDALSYFSVLPPIVDRPFVINMDSYHTSLALVSFPTRSVSGTGFYRRAADAREVLLPNITLIPHMLLRQMPGRSEFRLPNINLIPPFSTCTQDVRQMPGNSNPKHHFNSARLLLLLNQHHDFLNWVFQSRCSCPSSLDHCGPQVRRGGQGSLFFSTTVAF